MSPFLLLLPILLLSSSTSLGHDLCDTPDQGSTLKVFHVSSPCSPFKQHQLSWEDSVLQMQQKDAARLGLLSSLVAGRSVVPIASGRQIMQSPTYIVRVKVGTPPQTLLMALDTSSDTAWVPCVGCVGCSSATLFNSNKSTTFKPIGCKASQCQQVPNPICGGGACTFNTTYGGSTIAANLSTDTFKLSTDPIPNYTFACIAKTTGTSVPPQGLLGLGRGPLSLLSQTQSLYKSTFSYCLPSFKSPNFSGTLRLGTAAQPPQITYTPLLKNPRRSSLYYVNLIGIKVGRKTVDIAPSALAFNPSTGAGTIFDSGTVFTRFSKPVYTAVRDEFRKQVKVSNITSLGGFDTCYTVPIVAPNLTFMFQGLNMTLPSDNLLIHSTVGTTSCLAMAASPDNFNSVLNVIANMQQQNHRVLIDLPNSRLGVRAEKCT